MAASHSPRPLTHFKSSPALFLGMKWPPTPLPAMLLTGEVVAFSHVLVARLEPRVVAWVDTAGKVHDGPARRHAQADIPTVQRHLLEVRMAGLRGEGWPPAPTRFWRASAKNANLHSQLPSSVRAR